MDKIRKRWLAILLTFCMVMGSLPSVPVYADNEVTGLVAIWAVPKEGGGYQPAENYAKVIEIAPKRTGVLWFATRNDAGEDTLYTGDLTIKKVEGNTETEVTDGTVLTLEKHKENDLTVDGIYDVKFSESASGSYRIYGGDSYVTMEIGKIHAGFYSSSTISMATYIDEQSLVYSDDENREFYFAYEKNPNEDCTISIVTDEYGPVMDTNGQYGARIEKVSDSGQYGIYKITLGRNFGEYWGEIGVQFKTTMKDGNEISETAKLHLSYKQEGLVLAWPDENEEGLFVPENPEYGKEVSLTSKQTHVLHLAIMDSEGNPIPYNSGRFTIKSVAEDGETERTSTDATIEEHVDVIWNEEQGKEIEKQCPSLYDIKFVQDAFGEYRIYAGNSFITVYVDKPEAGFYSSNEINMTNYIDEQEWTYSEKKNREFYFAYKANPEPGITREIQEQAGKLFGLSGYSEDSNAVDFTQVDNSGDYTVYKVTLKEGFEGVWTDYSSLQVKLSRTGSEEPEEIGIGLFMNPEGFVCAWPQWGDGPRYTEIPKLNGNWFKSIGLDKTDVVFFGMKDEAGKVTAIRNVGDITITGTDNQPVEGAALEPYADNCPGYYKVILPVNNKDYVLKYGSSSVKIHKDTPAFGFFSNAACTQELCATFAVEGANNTFYFKLPELTGTDGEVYTKIMVRGEKSGTNSFDYYFEKDYSSAEASTIENPPVTITQVSSESDTATSAKIYKVVVKEDSPAYFSFCVKAEKENNTSIENNIYISNIKVENDPSSTFKGEGDKYVTLDEVPQPEDLVSSNANGYTENDLKNGASLSVTVKADAIAVDQGEVTIPDNATDEQRAMLEKAKDPVKKISDKVKNDLSHYTDPTFLDLSVKTTVKTKDSVGTKESSITKTKKPLIIKIPLPAGLKDKGHYVIIRYHDGVTDVLNVKVEGGYLIFETDRFSTYAIAYREQTDLEKDGISFTGLKWKNNGADTLTYNGLPQTCSVSLEGLPTGCEAVLSGNTATAVGTYKVKVEAITYKGVTYPAYELDLPKAITDGYNWAIEQDNTSSGGSSGGGPVIVIPPTPQEPTEPTEPTEPSEPDTPSSELKKGDVAEVNGSKYQVTTTTDKKKTVAFKGGNKTAKKVQIPASVVVNGQNYQVTEIADNALSGYTKLTSVTIPITVTKIGKNAFKNCSSLQKVTIPKNVTSIGNYAFYNCKKLTSVQFVSTKITKLGDGTFYKCSSLKSVTVPKSVKEIGKNAFRECTKLTKVTFSGTQVTKLGDSSFRKCTELKSVTIPSSVKEIGKDTFRECTKLSKITLKGTKITKIGTNAFANIAKNPTIYVPKSKKKEYKKLLEKAGYKQTIK